MAAELNPSSQTLGNDQRGASGVATRAAGDYSTTAPSISPQQGSPQRTRVRGRAEMSPKAKRVAPAIVAASPSGSQEMSNAELTHAYQTLDAQSAHDRNWMRTVEEAITDHASRIDVYSDLMATIDTRFVEVTKAVGDKTTQVDTELRDHVRAEDAATRARLEATEATLQKALGALDTELRQHTKEALQSLGERLHLVEVHCSATAYSPAPASAGTTRASGLDAATLQLKLGHLESSLSQLEGQTEAEVQKLKEKIEGTVTLATSAA